MKIFISYFFLTLVQVYWGLTIDLFAQSKIISGPMIFEPHHNQVIVWLQLTEPCNVKISYKTLRSDTWLYTQATPSQYLNIAKVPINIVNHKAEADTIIYQVWINDNLQSFDYPLFFKVEPTNSQHLINTPKDFSFITGSCALILDGQYTDGKKLQPTVKLKHNIFGHMNQQHADFMLWLGDNVYLIGKEMYDMKGIAYRYTYSRSLTELQPLLAQKRHYATWDDHDFGNNDATGDFPLKDSSTKIFNHFWINPKDSLVNFRGIATSFQKNDVDFFLLDDRYHRYPKANPPTMLGASQYEWLKKRLIQSHANFKFIVIGTQLFNFTYVGESFLTDYEAEVNDLCKFIVDNKIEGVVFLSGDRHYTEINKWTPPQGYPIFEFCISPLLSIPSALLLWKPHPYRVGKFKTGKRNYGLFEISGNTANRTLTLKVFDKKGKFLWKYAIKASELKFPKKQTE